MHGLRLQSRDEIIGQSRQRLCNPSCRVCMRGYGVILYHIGIGLGLSINIKAMLPHFPLKTVTTVDCLSHLGVFSCEAKVFPQTLVVHVAKRLYEGVVSSETASPTCPVTDV